MQLSKHLELSEVTDSPTAKRLGISNQPTPEHIENFKKLAEHIFEPIREHFGVPIYISSGYRSAALNKAIKGSSTTSYHIFGKAVDLDQQNKKNGITNKQVFDFIKDNLFYSELIWEFGTSSQPDWVHVAYDEKKLNKETLKSVRVGKTVKYLSY